MRKELIFWANVAALTAVLALVIYASSLEKTYYYTANIYTNRSVIKT